jgi:hypothetical protein
MISIKHSFNYYSIIKIYYSIPLFSVDKPLYKKLNLKTKDLFHKILSNISFYACVFKSICIFKSLPEEQIFDNVEYEVYLNAQQNSEDENNTLIIFDYVKNILKIFS